MTGSNSFGMSASGRRTSPSRLALFLLFCLAGLAPAWGQTPPSEEASLLQDNATFEGWYVVRAGDTLRGISVRYLGEESRWEENWRLNPWIVDPDRLKPGQRIRVLFRRLPEDGALLAKISNVVEGQQLPLPWENSRLYDLLRSRDGLRTAKRSSAALVFADRSELKVTEESLVFLEQQPAAEGRASRDVIDIELGQADLEGRSEKAKRGDIEIVLGGVKAKPKTGPDGQVRTRARRPTAGGAQLMVYEGEGEVSAGGAKVALPRGTGSATAEGAPPGPAEKLLDAPALAEPADLARLQRPRPEFRWSAVPGASYYTLELCQDAGCAKLAERITGLAEPAWRPPVSLGLVTLFWRATAVSRSGLDGYPAATRSFTVAAETEDQMLPTVRLQVDGPHLAPRFGLNSDYILGREARLGVVALDDSGPPRVVCTLDGAEVGEATWRGPFTPGRHQAGCQAYDAAGNRGELATFEFVYDVEPPTLTWGIEGEGPQGSFPLGPAEDLPRQPARQKLEGDDPHSIWPWHRQTIQIEDDTRQLVLRPSRPLRLAFAGQEIELGPGKGLWILADDSVCRSIMEYDYELSLEIRGGLFRKHYEGRLRLEVKDWVDNAAGADLRFESRR
jgi:hypothetical protein